MQALLLSLLALGGGAALGALGGPWGLLLGSLLIVAAVANLLGELDEPRSYTFTQNEICLDRYRGARHFHPSRFDSIELRPGPYSPRLLLRFCDGARLAIHQDRVALPLADLEPRLREALAPLATPPPWPREQDVFLHYSAFGPGSHRPFSRYLEGSSGVATSSVEGVCAWLRTCEYVSDEELFGRQDVWQHPLAFEKLRRGDCEDHALWAWHKLVALELEAEFVVGQRNGLPHAWVTFEQGRGVHLLKASAKDGPMVAPADNVRDEYRPLHSVNRYLVTYSYSQP